MKKYRIYSINSNLMDGTFEFPDDFVFNKESFYKYLTSENSGLKILGHYTPMFCEYTDVTLLNISTTWDDVDDKDYTCFTIKVTLDNNTQYRTPYISLFNIVDLSTGQTYRYDPDEKY